jgi:hypothetical protein
MTLAPTHGTAERPPLPAWAAGTSGRPGLERQLDHLDRAIDAARTLGVATEVAARVRDDAAARLGFPADVYVLALVGGTGVGKSSLLNALAGARVSPASVRRPTTDRPVAWVPGPSRDELAGLLDWLDVAEVREHDEADALPVAILDLPDMDSLEAAHRDRVEAILPKVDAVAWITDPEKYHDAALHDGFLHEWLRRLATQAVVINKADRLEAASAESIRGDLERDLVRAAPGHIGGRIPVLVGSALPGDERLGEVVEWLRSAVESKRVVRARLAATITAVIDDLARAAGIDPLIAATPILDPVSRRQAIDAVTADVLRAIDLPGLQRQAVAATRARARARGTGPIGLITSAIYRLSGREARVADPGSYLVRWRDRGPLGPAVESLRRALIEPVRDAAPAVRPALATAIEPDRLRAGLAAAIDRAVARDDQSVPMSRVWTVIGTLQTIATAATILAAAWVVVWILARPPVDVVELPLLGSVPMPFLALVASLGAGYVLARLLGVHAGWIGRRWAARLRTAVHDAVGDQLREHALAPLDRLESARRALWYAARSASEDARRD